MSEHDYGFYGWRVRSRIDLSPVPLGSRGEPDLVLSFSEVGQVPAIAPDGEVLAEFPPRQAGAKMYWLVEQSDGFLLRFPGQVEFAVSRDLREVACRRAHPEPLGDVIEMFCGNTMSLFLSLAGEAVFHSSAVALGTPENLGRAVGIFGGMGAGKSTIAAVLVADGARFLTDDVLRVRASNGRAFVVGSCSELRLRRPSWSLADRLPEAPRRQVSEDRLALALGSGDLAATELGLLVFPKVAEEGPMQVRSLRPNETALALAGVPRMSGWLRKDVLERQFSCLGELAVSLPALEIAMPRGGALTETFAARLRQALAEHMPAP
ncbi:MAG TPA: hypothetical protein VK425_04790 [Acidimicrobiales bacterium]|nr:hypothetical protein [Acidimicrobiales bacterium]